MRRFALTQRRQNVATCAELVEASPGERCDEAAMPCCAKDFAPMMATSCRGQGRARQSQKRVGCITSSFLIILLL